MRAVIGVETGVPFIMLYEYAVFWLSQGVILGQSPAAAWHWLLCGPAWSVFLQFLFCLPPSLAQFVFKRFFATLIKRFLHATAHTIHVCACVCGCFMYLAKSIINTSTRSTWTRAVAAPHHDIHFMICPLLSFFMAWCRRPK